MLQSQSFEVIIQFPKVLPFPHLNHCCQSCNPKTEEEVNSCGFFSRISLTALLEQLNETIGFNKIVIETIISEKKTVIISHFTCLERSSEFFAKVTTDCMRTTLQSGNLVTLYCSNNRRNSEVPSQNPPVVPKNLFYQWS